MTFNVWMESQIKYGAKNDDGTSVVIHFPNGKYEYTTEYGPMVRNLLNKYKYAPGKFVNAIKPYVDKGYVKSNKLF